MLSNKQAEFIRTVFGFSCSESHLVKPHDWTDAEFEGLLRKLGFGDDHWLMKELGIPKQPNPIFKVGRSNVLTPEEFEEALSRR